MQSRSFPQVPGLSALRVSFCLIVVASLSFLSARPAAAQHRQLPPAPPICHNNMTVSNDPGKCSAVVTFETGTVAGATVTASPASGSVFPVGTTTVTITVTNSGGTASCQFTVTVEDTEAPVISNVSVSQKSLWPPNHKMVPITIDYDVSDNCSGLPVSTELSVSSNEPIDGRGDGHTAPDWQVIDGHHLLLRAERAGPGTGRIYTITIIAVVGSESTSTSVTVTVPHDQSP